jgi:hypothetical protein
MSNQTSSWSLCNAVIGAIFYAITTNSYSYLGSHVQNRGIQEIMAGQASGLIGGALIGALIGGKLERGYNFFNLSNQDAYIQHNAWVELIKLTSANTSLQLATSVLSEIIGRGLLGKPADFPAPAPLRDLMIDLTVGAALLYCANLLFRIAAQKFFGTDETTPPIITTAQVISSVENPIANIIVSNTVNVYQPLLSQTDEENCHNSV